MRPDFVKSAIALVLLSFMSATVADTSPEQSGNSSVVNIAGQRYVRAVDKVAAQGGDTGSRIILDGNLYLLDDGNLNPAMIYRAPVETALPKGGVSSVEPAVMAETAQTRRQEARSRARTRARIEQQRLDARATSVRIAVERQRIARLQDGVDDDPQKINVEKLRIDKARLELESARRARAVIQARAVNDPDKALEPQSISRAPLVSIEAVAVSHSVDDALLLSHPAGMDRKVTLSAVPQSKELESVSTPELSAASPMKLAVLERSAMIEGAQRYRYLEALPVNYDVGGYGLMVEGSGFGGSPINFIGRLGITDEYSEFMLGGGYYLTPENAQFMTLALMAGLEYGTFELRDNQPPGLLVDFSDSGIYLAAASRLTLSRRFEINAGVGYSSLFEGDTSFFGGANYHLSRKLDFLTRFELGDNDLLGIGLRYYY